VTKGILKAVEDLEKKYSTIPGASTKQPDAPPTYVLTPVESAAQTTQAIDTTTMVSDKSTVNSVIDAPDALNGNKVEDQLAEKMLPERKTEISDSKSRILIGHSKVVRSVAISPDGKTIVSGSGDTTVKIWDMEAGKGSYSAHSQVIQVRFGAWQLV
jgi:WD40 repeat protein